MTKKYVTAAEWTDSYDAENRLTEIEYQDGSITRFLYDGDGKRVARLNVDNEGTIYIGNYFESEYPYIEDTRPPLYLEPLIPVVSGLCEAETESCAYLPVLAREAELRPFPVKRGTSYYYADGQRIAMRTGSETYLLFGDHLASSILLVRGEGTVAEKAYYLPWGGTRGDETITSTDYGYTGQMREGDIYYYGARWYDADIGRFMQADTIVPLQVQGTQAFDRYAYVNNNPLRYTDPSGFYIIDGWNDDYLQLQDGNACGVVALAMGLSVLYQKKVTQADLQSKFPLAQPISIPILHKDVQGVGVLPAQLSAKTNLGFGQGVIATSQPNGTIEELRQNIFDNKPTIVLIQLPEKKSIGHYLLIIGYSDEEGFIFADPHNIRRNELEFVDRWGKERGFSSFTEVWSQDYWPALQPNTMITLEYNTGTTYGTFLQYVNYQNPTRLTGRWGDREETR